MPNEVLQLIFTHLDGPASFSLVNQSFRSLSEDTLWRASWFKHYYAPYEVLFQAISLPLVFSDQLLESLLRLGAPLSRNLVQLLHFVSDHGPCEDEECGCDPMNGIKWGKVSSNALAVIDRHAKDLVGGGG